MRISLIALMVYGVNVIISLGVPYVVCGRKQDIQETERLYTSTGPIIS
jgi:hypothetical protein